LTLLITGGAGFIGSNFVHYVLAHTSHQLVVVDKLTYAGSLLNLEDAIPNPRVTFIRADIADRDAMARLFTEHRPDAVVNLAAETHVDRSIDGPRPFVDTNVVGTFVLLDVARQFAGEAQTSSTGDRDSFRFLHVSTDEVYGALGPTGLFSEETPYAPNSPYAASKASADHFVRAYAHTYGLPVLITNCSNNYGPYQFPEKLIPLTIANALDGRDLPVYGRLWVDPADGSIRKTELHAVDPSVEGHITVTFAPDEAAGMVVPVKMEERYRRGRDTTEVRGVATYSKFRRFQVSTSEALNP